MYKLFSVHDIYLGTFSDRLLELLTLYKLNIFSNITEPKTETKKDITNKPATDNDFKI